MSTIARTAMAAELGLTLSPAYWREIERLYDPKRPQDYRVHIVRPGDNKPELRKVATEIQAIVFDKTDGNTREELAADAKPWQNHSAMLVLVDQRPGPDGRPRNIPRGMMRLAWGSPERSLPTAKALRGDPWYVKDVDGLFRRNKVPPKAPQWRSSMDIVMIGMLTTGIKEGETFHDPNGSPMIGMLAQTCRLGIKSKSKWWFTILNKSGFRIIRGATDVDWMQFQGNERTMQWLPYFTRKKTKSSPLWLDFRRWVRRLWWQNRKLYKDLFKNGLSKRFAFDV